ncbi:MAG TPA: hypothetical protein VIC06_06140 [Solirubrobacteraceae bacterium]
MESVREPLVLVELSEVVLVEVEVVEWVVGVEVVVCVRVLCEVVVWMLVGVGVVVLVEVEVEVEVEVLSGSPEVVDSVLEVVGSPFWTTGTAAEAERVARASR